MECYHHTVTPSHAVKFSGTFTSQKHQTLMNVVCVLF